MPSTTIRYPRLPENSREFPRDYAPRSTPATPNHEPDHLRHRPGDDWQIGGRPHDPEDRGPYGSPGWRPDNRTGRHRRDELPDPQDHVQPRRPNPGVPAASRRDDEPFRFSDLREAAFRRYMRFSEPLAAAHDQDRSALDSPNRVLALLRLLVTWIVTVIKGAEPDCLPAKPENEYSLRRFPSDPPRPTSPYLRAWEANFDACHPVSGNEAVL